MPNNNIFGNMRSTQDAISNANKRIDATSRNLQQAGNPNHIRLVESQTAGDMVRTEYGSHVSAPDLVRVAQALDHKLEEEIVLQKSVTGKLGTEEAGASKLLSSLSYGMKGQGSLSSLKNITSSDRMTGLSGAFEAFFTASNRSAQEPMRTDLKAIVFEKAQDLTNHFHQIDHSIRAVDTTQLQEAQKNVDSANGALDRLARLNGLIQKNESALDPGGAFELRNERRVLLQSLSEILPVEPLYPKGELGQLQLQIRDQANTPILILDGSDQRDSFQLSGSDVTLSSGGQTLAMSGGKLAGNLAISKEAIHGTNGAIAALDKIANQFVLAANHAYGSWTNASGATAHFFNPSLVTAQTIALDADLSASTIETGTTGAQSDNTRVKNLSLLATKAFSTTSGDLIDGTLTGAYVQVVEKNALRIQTLRDQLSSEEAFAQSQEAHHSAISEVSIDTELPKLIELVNSLQAILRTFTRVDEILQEIIRL